MHKRNNKSENQQLAGNNRHMARTCSSELGIMEDVSQSCNSLCRVCTSSTEHFLLATFATLSSSRLASRLALSGSICGRSSSRRCRSTRMVSSFASSVPRLFASGRAEVVPVVRLQSARMRRMLSAVNGSRQNGHTGVREGGVFWHIVVLQSSQRTWPICALLVGCSRKQIQCDIRRTAWN